VRVARVVRGIGHRPWSVSAAYSSLAECKREKPLLLCLPDTVDPRAPKR